MSAEVVKMSNQDKDRNIALESAIGQIEKAFGKGSVMKLGTSGENLDVQAVSTGSLGLDIACTSKFSPDVPNFITEPLPKAFSICPIADSKAMFLSLS